LPEMDVLRHEIWLGKQLVVHSSHGIVAFSFLTVLLINHVSSLLSVK
jgi:hypothetical protein